MCLGCVRGFDGRVQLGLSRLVAALDDNLSADSVYPQQPANHTGNAPPAIGTGGRVLDHGRRVVRA